MRIVDIREKAIPLRSSLRNSSFDFSEMTTSIVAVITDVKREGRPVVGFAFNSTGRYACGAQMRARFIPRVLSADPDSLLTHDAHAADPSYAFALSRLDSTDFSHTPIGVFRQVERPSYDELMTGQIEAASTRGVPGLGHPGNRGGDDEHPHRQVDQEDRTP